MQAPTFNPSWSPEVQALYRHDIQEIWDPTIARHIWNQYHNQLDLYLDLAGREGGADILDVGCAQGTLALLLAEAGHRVTAMDIRPDFLAYARSRYTHGDIRFVTGNVLEQPPGGSYDIVFANQIIEHLVYPQQLVSRLKTVLKPGGTLIVTTPNWEYCRIRLPSYAELGDPRALEHRQHSADAEGHFYAFKSEELASIFQQCGFQEVVAQFFETPWISGHMKIRYTHRWLPGGLLRMLDRATLQLPWLGRKLAHQLLVRGRSHQACDAGEKTSR
jgi:2-polyprenyl-3-methyl-5-hydroxy-6-metoxy-1,4-benzoquinol methylase